MLTFIYFLLLGVLFIKLYTEVDTSKFFILVLNGAKENETENTLRGASENSAV